MVWSVLRSPVIFFDGTSSGQIMTRFSTDIMSTDFALPKILDGFLNTGFKMIASTVFI
jgi:hypothetical protein